MRGKQSNLLEDMTEDPDLAFALGVRFEFGWGVKPNLKSALEVYQQSKLAKHKAALYRSWKVILKLRTTDSELKRIAALSLKKSAALGYPPAMFDIFLYGPPFLGLSDTNAKKWLTRAAAAKDKAAMMTLATNLLQSDKATRSSQKRAEQLLKELVKEDQAQAKFLLAREWLKQNQKSARALSLMKEAAEADYPAANQFFKWAYHDGTHGLKRDVRLSEKYSKRAEASMKSLLDFGNLE